MIDTVPAVAGIHCKATALTFQHLCPIKDEHDRGTLHLTWTTTTVTLELHSLADYLHAWRDAAMTHEAICDRIAHDLTTNGVDNVTVTFVGYTAGLTITTTAGEPTHALLREPLHTTGA
jgi:NADPH-dependent 7-cyano-7-deazaguanine reductase QueF